MDAAANYSKYIANIPAKFYSADGTPIKVADPDYQEAINLMFANPVVEIKKLQKEVTELRTENDRLKSIEEQFLKLKARLGSIAKDKNPEPSTPSKPAAVVIPTPVEVALPKPTAAETPTTVVKEIPPASILKTLVSTHSLVNHMGNEAPEKDQHATKFAKIQESTLPAAASESVKEKPAAPTLASATTQSQKPLAFKTAPKPKGRRRKLPLEVSQEKSPAASKPSQEKRNNETVKNATSPTDANKKPKAMPMPVPAPAVFKKPAAVATPAPIPMPITASEAIPAPVHKPVAVTGQAIPQYHFMKKPAAQSTTPATQTQFPLRVHYITLPAPKPVARTIDSTVSSAVQSLWFSPSDN